MDYSTLGVGLIDWALQLFGIFFNRSVACHSFLSFPTYLLSHEITFVLESKIKAIDCNLTFLRDCLTLPRSDQLTTSNNNSTPQARPMHPIFLWVCIQQTFHIASAYKTFIIIRSSMPQNIANNSLTWIKYHKIFVEMVLVTSYLCGQLGSDSGWSYQCLHLTYMEHMGTIIFLLGLLILLIEWYLW